MAKSSQIDGLASLAMLKAQAEAGDRDYTDCLVPFALHALTHLQQDVVTNVPVREIIGSEFGLNLPLHAVEIVLRRLTKRKMLEKNHGQYRRTSEFRAYDLTTKRNAERLRQDQLIVAVWEYGTAMHHLNWSRDEATLALTAYVSRFGIDFLKSFVARSILGEIEADESQHVTSVHSFGNFARTGDPQSFERLVDLVKGHMLACSLLCDDSETLARKFDHLTIYFDTPLLVRLIGLEGPALQMAAQELVTMMNALGARIVTFKHTFVETCGVLKGVGYSLEDPYATGRALFEMRAANRTQTDLNMMVDDLEEILYEAGVRVVETPPFSHPEHRYELQIDEEILARDLQNAIGYYDSRTRQQDINSIRSIYYLRTGVHPQRLEDSRAVLVTTNVELARVTFAFGKEHEDSKEAPAVITDYSLATLAWLKLPLERRPDLARIEIIADCRVALDIPDSLWIRFLNVVDDLASRKRISKSAHEMLRVTPQVRSELMNLTLGSDEGLTEATVSEIISRVEKELVQEHHQLLEAEKADHARTREREDQVNNMVTAVRKKISSGARKTAIIVSWTITIFIFAVLVTAAFFSSYFDWPIKGNLWLNGALAIVLLIAVFYASLAIWGKNLSLTDVRSLIAKRVYRKSAKRGRAKWLPVTQKLTSSGHARATPVAVEQEDQTS